MNYRYKSAILGIISTFLAITFPKQLTFAAENSSSNRSAARIAYLARDIKFPPVLYDSIRVVNSDGSNKHTFTHKEEFVNNLSWSPDGRQLRFGNVFGNVLWGSCNIDVIDSGGINRKRLAENGPYDEIAWSPDGKEIAFVKRDSRKVEGHDHDLFVMNSDGSNVRNLTNSPAFYATPAWSPKGDKLAFTGSIKVVTGPFAISRIGFFGRDESNFTRLRGLEKLMPAVEPGPVDENGIRYKDIDYNLSWFPDGSRILINNPPYKIRVVNLDGSGMLALATGEYGSPSPDSSKIVFQGRENGNYEIYVMDANGNNQVNITKNPAEDYHPLWGPDGQNIFFISRRVDLPGIYCMNSDGSDVKRVVTDFFKLNGTMHQEYFYTISR